MDFRCIPVVSTGPFGYKRKRAVFARTRMTIAVNTEHCPVLLGADCEWSRAGCLKSTPAEAAELSLFSHSEVISKRLDVA